MDQARQAAAYLLKTYPRGGNDLIIGINGLLDNLVFREDGYEPFEQGLMHLGASAQRPEKQGASRLDVLWASVSSNTCFSHAKARRLQQQYRHTTLTRSAGQSIGFVKPMTTHVKQCR
jgi:hypothetical protein